MPKPHNIEMIFYSHPWSMHLLGEGIVEEGKRNIIIEVADISQLEYVCGGKARSSKGVLPLLTQPSKVDLFALAASFPLIPAPIILSANPHITPQALIHSLMVLESRSFDCDNVYLMCHISEASKYGALFCMVDRFSILWDVADYPTTDIVDCTRSLMETESLAGNRWGGFHVRNHWLRKTPDLLHNTDQIEQLAAAAGL